MANRLSHSSIYSYSQCGRKYKFHYIDKLRSRYLSGALLFGGAIDQALNHLLETKNLEESIGVFEKVFTINKINNEPQYIPDNINIVYAKADFDKDLINDEDRTKYQEYKTKLGLDSTSSLEQDVAYLLGIKEDKGLKALADEERKIYNYANWLSMRQKGLIMINSYNKEIIPQINEVLGIQMKVDLKNDKGDEIVMYPDLVVEWKDGKRYLLDNKTSTKEYASNSAMNSQQLILYYHTLKEELKLDGVGFIVMYKQIMKNRTKKCLACGKDGTGQRHKTCDNEINSKRCNGEWLEKIKPEARIQVILNEVPEAAENLVIETFDEANEGINKGVFAPNLNACGSSNSEYRCAFWEKCWQGKDDELVKV